MDDDEQTQPGSAELVLSSLSKAIAEISGFSECRGPFRRSYYDLKRRIKLLSPLVDELADGVSVEEAELGALVSLLDILVSAKELLWSVNEGSKLYQKWMKAWINIATIVRSLRTSDSLGPQLSRSPADLSSGHLDWDHFGHSQPGDARRAVILPRDCL